MRYQTEKVDVKHHLKLSFYVGSLSRIRDPVLIQLFDDLVQDEFHMAKSSGSDRRRSWAKRLPAAQCRRPQAKAVRTKVERVLAVLI